MISHLSLSMPLDFQLLVAVGAESVPAVAVLALVAGDVLFVGVQRPVRGGVGYVQEERLFVAVVRTRGAVGGCVLVEHLDGVVGDGIREVVACRVELEEAVVLHQEAWEEVVGAAGYYAVEAVEASLRGNGIAVTALQLLPVAVV